MSDIVEKVAAVWDRKALEAELAQASAKMVEQAARIEQLEAEAKTRTLDYLGQVGQLSEEVTRLRAALEVCDRVLHFDLRGMITWGKDYNQAVKDAADAARAALEEHT